MGFTNRLTAQRPLVTISLHMEARPRQQTTSLPTGRPTSQAVGRRNTTIPTVSTTTTNPLARRSNRQRTVETTRDEVPGALARQRRGGDSNKDFGMNDRTLRNRSLFVSKVDATTVKQIDIHTDLLVF